VSVSEAARRLGRSLRRWNRQHQGTAGQSAQVFGGGAKHEKLGVVGAARGTPAGCRRLHRGSRRWRPRSWLAIDSQQAQ